MDLSGQRYQVTTDTEMERIASTIGASFIGCLLAAIFYGVTCLQAARYFLHCGADGNFTKGLVLTIVTLDTLHMALVSHFMYTLVVFDYGDPSKLAVPPWSLATSFVVTVTSDTIIRIFFARRAWYLSQRNKLVAIFLALSILMAFVVSLMSSIDVIIMVRKQTGQFQGILKSWMLDFAFASTAAADFTIAATLCFYFYKSRSDYFEGTNRVVNTLCKYTINTGITATVWAACCLISNVLAPDTDMDLTFYLSLSKVYVNAFLGSLIVRDSLRAKSNLVLYTPNLNTVSLPSIASEAHKNLSVGAIEDSCRTSIKSSISARSSTSSYLSAQWHHRRSLSVPSSWRAT